MQHKPNNPTPAPWSLVSKMRGIYDGKELLPYASRPGAMDAFKLPSMHQGKPRKRGEFK